MPHRRTIGQCDGDGSSTEGPSSQLTLICSKLTKKQISPVRKGDIHSLSTVMERQKNGKFVIVPCPTPRLMPAIWELNQYLLSEWVWRMAMSLYLTLEHGHRKPATPFPGHISGAELFEGREPRFPFAVRFLQTCSPGVCCYLEVDKPPGIRPSTPIC